VEEVVGIPLTYDEALQFRWPTRSKLPEGERSDANDRHLAYEPLVEGADLLGPLDRAAGYLLAR
jgi:hypothetical protein